MAYNSCGFTVFSYFTMCDKGNRMDPHQQLAMMVLSGRHQRFNFFHTKRFTLHLRFLPDSFRCFPHAV